MVDLGLFIKMTSLDELPTEYKNTLIRHLTIFKIVGFDIFRRPDCGFFEKYGRAMFFNCMFLPFIALQVLFIVMSNNSDADFLEVAGAVPVAVSLIQDVIKMIVVIHKNNEIRQVIIEIAELWPNNETLNVNKRKIVDLWLKRLSFFDDAYFAVTVFGCSMYQITPLLITIYNYLSNSEPSYLVPFLLFYPNEINTTAQYVATYVCQVVSFSFLHIGIFLPCDFLLVALTCNISILLILLQHDIENFDVPKRISNDGFTNSNKHEDMKKLLKTHQKLLRLADKLNLIFGPVIFVLVSFSSLIICFFGFLSVVVSGMKILKNVVPVVVIVFTVFNLSWPGQLLWDTSSGVADAAYRSLWYESDLKFRKLIFIIIARSQKPCCLSAMGFSNMTLTAFSKVMSTAWSYLSLLRQMYQKLESKL